MVFDERTIMITCVGYWKFNDGQVEDRKFVYTTCLSVKDLKAIAGVHIKIDI